MSDTATCGPPVGDDKWAMERASELLCVQSNRFDRGWRDIYRFYGTWQCWHADDGLWRTPAIMPPGAWPYEVTWREVADPSEEGE